MLTSIDDAFLLRLKDAYSSSSVSSELVRNYSSIETLEPESYCLSAISPSKLFLILIDETHVILTDVFPPTLMMTHFDMTNPNHRSLAYSVIKKSVVQIQRTTTEDLLRLTNYDHNRLSTNSSSSIVSFDDMPRVRGPKSTRFTCPICGLITVSMERLQKHVNQHGQKLRLETYKPERKLSSLICKKCKATFSSAYALRKHQRVHTRGIFSFFNLKIETKTLVY